MTPSSSLGWDGEVPTLQADGACRHFVGPLLVRWWDGRDEVTCHGRYSRRDGDVAEGVVNTPRGGTLAFRDRWWTDRDVVHLERTVEVVSEDDGAFLTEVRLDAGGVDEVGPRLFVPGTQYGDATRVNRAALAGPDSRAAGDRAFLVREDRMPAPVLAALLPDGSSVTVLDPHPDGRTLLEDAEDAEIVSVIDAALRFGAFGLDHSSGRALVSFLFPGTEGPVTYRGNTFPDGQVRQWRRRYHPMAAGQRQTYALAWRLGRPQSMPALVGAAWRWAWECLQPTVAVQDIDGARAQLVDQLASSAVVNDDRAGFPHFVDSTTGRRHVPRHRQDTHTLMGFTGRGTDCAYYLLREASRLDGDRAQEYADIARRVLDSFATLPIDPPQGEGFDIETGEIVPAAPHHGREDVMLLRGLAEGAKSMLRAWRYERDAGRRHGSWYGWGMGLTNWLLRHQRTDGSFPRSWRLGSDDVVDPSGSSTFNMLSLLVEASLSSGDDRLLAAAVKAGTYCWESGHADGVFVGGTVDNPDVIDKEAGTLSLEGYLALLDATGDERWVDRAIAAAGFAETWIYLWDVEMAYLDDAGRGWKRDAPTTGAQLIASGHSLVDQYMAFDVGSYARLWSRTGDPHHLEVARLLLHNTKTMLAIGDRTWDLAGPGWQQEHWSFAPVRGEGLHRGWLPWVTCSHLEGIVTLEDLDPELLRSLSQPG